MGLDTRCGFWLVFPVFISVGGKGEVGGVNTRMSMDKNIRVTPIGTLKVKTSTFTLFAGGRER